MKKVVVVIPLQVNVTDEKGWVMMITSEKGDGDS